MENNPKYAVLHHTGDAQKSAQFDKVNEWHKFKEFPKSSLGYFCGYHYFIERNGTLISARLLSDEGAHTKGRNLESIGIGLAGNFDFENPSEAQLDALNLLLDNLAARYKLPQFDVFYHHKFSDTHCPGAFFLGKEWPLFIIGHKINLLQRLIKWISNLLRK